MSRAAISLIQTGLRDLGYDPGRIDGIAGGVTMGAVAKWIAAGGRATVGQVKSDTTAVLMHGNVPVDEIIVHCSDTRPDWMADAPLALKRAEIDRWHKLRGFNGFGYHWLIDRDGKVLDGRRETEIGAHVEGHNTGAIGICIIGGHGCTEHDAFAEHFTAAQDTSLRQLIQGIGMRTRITRVSGHNEYAAKACPGFNVPAWLKGA